MPATVHETDSKTNELTIPVIIVSVWTLISVIILFGNTFLAPMYGWFGLAFAAGCILRFVGNGSFRRISQTALKGIRSKFVQDTNMKVLKLDDLPVPMMSISENGIVSQSNFAARELLGILEGEQPLLSDLIDGIGRSVSQWIDTVKKGQSSSRTEFVRAKRGHEEKHLQLQLSCSEKFQNMECLCMVQDATELKTLEAQFVQSQKMEAIGQLAGGIAHDFNNLLTAISGYCDLLMLRHEKGDSDHSDLMQISSNANRAAALVGQLLAYSRKQTMQMRAVQINDVLAEITHLLNRLVGEKIDLAFDRAKNLPPAFVDSRQLEQVIMNLVVNARDAMPKGGEIRIISRLIETTSDERREDVRIYAGKYVSIEVSNSGCGIPKTNLKKIFEPFFSTKEVGQGTGLGLSMVYGIVKQTGGYIFAESEIGKGTQFTLFLPVTERVVEKPIEKERKLESPGSISGLRILLVEDEDPVRAFSTRALQGQGAIVSGANCGAEALSILEEAENSFDVIVTDVVMPDMDGPTWIKKAGTQLMESSIVFVSGYTEEAFKEEWGQFNDSVFLPKPYSLKKLVSTVSEISGS